MYLTRLYASMKGHNLLEILPKYLKFKSYVIFLNSKLFWFEMVYLNLG